MSQSKPIKKTGTRLCITVTKSGVTIYGNPQAFKSLAEWMQWLADSNPSDHFECHVGMSLEDDESKFEGKKPKNFWVLSSESLSSHLIRADGVNTEFELTFMMAEESDLDTLSHYQEKGIIPDSK